MIGKHAPLAPLGQSMNVSIMVHTLGYWYCWTRNDGVDEVEIQLRFDGDAGTVLTERTYLTPVIAEKHQKR